MIELLLALREYSLTALDELSLFSKNRGDLPPFKGFIGMIPGEEEKPRASDFPLLIFRLNNFEDPEGGTDSTFTVRILVGVYNPEESNNDKCSPGYHDLCNALTRLRQALLKRGYIGNRWRRTGKLEGGPFDIQPYPYFFGDIVATYAERQTTEELSVEEEIDTYGSAYGNDQTDSWRYPADTPDRTDDERSAF